MKKVFISLFLVATLSLSVTSCKKADSPDLTANEIQAETFAMKSATYEYHTFEEALSEFATDAVIAQYVTHNPFGENQTLVEYEFIVLERVLGNAAERIFVYTESAEERDKTDVSFVGTERHIPYKPGDLEFNTESTYLLILHKIESALSSTHKDGFTFIDDIVIDLNEPSKSLMYSEELAFHSDELDFTDDNLSEKEIIEFVEELTADNTQGKDFIEVDSIEGIIDGSPYVLIAEVGDLYASPRTDWMSTDIYNVTAVQLIKGELPENHEFMLVFPANTAQPGERYIVAIEPIEEGYDDWFRLTSPESLFDIESLDEVIG
ncbi:MAG: hypothetical protein FWF94_06565 [Oscillospiraceae bacterium]|nr:hypothetical protein [Oscillospiraceae bacterium]